MTQRQSATGMIAGAVWAIFVVGILPGLITVPLPVTLFLSQTIMSFAGFGAGLIVIAMIGVQAARRFRHGGQRGGAEFPKGSKGEIDARVLRNTMEQVVLALLIWPMLTISLGWITVAVLGANFFVARIVFWIGYRRGSALRAFGFAATFYPTVLAALWSLLKGVA